MSIFTEPSIQRWQAKYS